MAAHHPIQLRFNLGITTDAPTEAQIAEAIAAAKALRAVFYHDLFAGLVRNIRTRLGIARTVRALEALDERTLADIGVERAYIRDYAEALFQPKPVATNVVALPKAESRDAQPELPIAA